MKVFKRLALYFIVIILCISLICTLIACGEDKEKQKKSEDPINPIENNTNNDGNNVSNDNANDTDENSNQVDSNQTQNNDGDINNNQQTPDPRPDNNNQGGENSNQQTNPPAAVEYIDYEAFMVDRAAIADTIVNSNKDGILELIVGEENAENFEIANYSLHVSENADLDNISSAKATILLQGKGSNIQKVAVLNVNFGENLTSANKDALIAGCTITEDASYTIRSTDSANVELKLALAECFLSETGISFNYDTVNGTDCYDEYGKRQ